MSDSVGSVSELWRFPVKSMQGEKMERFEVTGAGVVGDRAFALIDTGDGKVVSAKNPRKWGRVATRLGMPGANQHTAFLCAQRKNGAGLNDICRLGIFSRGDLDGTCTISCRDAGRHPTCGLN